MFEPTLVKLCYGCQKEFAHDLVECPFCNRMLVYPPQAYALPPAPEPPQPQPDKEPKSDPGTPEGEGDLNGPNTPEEPKEEPAVSGAEPTA